MRKFALYFIGVILAAGGIMGLIKGFFPEIGQLGFRYFLYESGTFPVGETPLYTQIYGIIMAFLEIITATLIFLRQKKLFLFCIITIIINMVGCLIAVFLGDLFAIISLLLRIVPLYLFVKEYRAK